MRFMRRWKLALVPLPLLAVSFAAPIGVARASLASSSQPAGSLTAVGICPFDYVFDTGGQSYSQVSTTGILTGFTPETTYYLYDNNSSFTTGSGAFPSARIVSNSSGDLMLNAVHLGLIGPAGGYLYYGDSTHPLDTGELRYYVSTDPSSSYEPPDQLVYSPPTVLAPSKTCSPWVVPGGTEFSPAQSPEGMYNSNRATPPPPGSPAQYYFDGTGPDSGNYCLYEYPARGNTYKYLWCTHTKASSDRLVMQRDGNLVVYLGHKALWSSGTWGHPGARLVLQRDRNLVIYSAAGRALWATGTYFRH